jgi:hypothetical protein
MVNIQCVFVMGDLSYTYYMNKNTRNILSALIVIAFIVGGIWYYRAMQSSQPGVDGRAPFIPSSEPADKGGMQLPTGAPYVTPPTTPPPANITPSR